MDQIIHLLCGRSLGGHIVLDVLHLEHDRTVYFGYSIISILLCSVKLFVVFILLPFAE